jgi:hypothetical protein
LIPWRIFLGIIIVISLVVAGIAWLVKLYVRRMLTLAGLQNTTPLQKQLAPKRRKTVSVVAPIEAGILDLRSRFTSHKCSKLSELYQFVIEYRLFFIGVLMIGLVLYIIVWFFNSVGESDRAYEVKISGAGDEVVLDSESLAYEAQQQTNEVVAKRDVPPLKLINRSGVNGTAARVALALEELGYTIDEVSTDLNTVQPRTVVVFDPSVTDDAVDLGEILNGALPSPFTAEAGMPPTITVFIGADLADR